MYMIRQEFIKKYVTLSVPNFHWYIEKGYALCSLIAVNESLIGTE